MNDTMSEQTEIFYKHFGLQPDDSSALKVAVDYLIEGESSDEFIRSYARGYAEMAGWYTEIKAYQLTNDHLTAENARLLNALVESAIALEVLFNEPSNPMISPSLHAQIRKAVMLTREVVIGHNKALNPTPDDGGAKL